METNNLVIINILIILFNNFKSGFSYEHRYVPESGEFDKMLMHNSISNRPNLISKRSDINYHKYGYLPKFHLYYTNNNHNNNKYNYNSEDNNNNNNNKIKNVSYSYLDKDKFNFDETVIDSKFDIPEQPLPLPLKLTEINRLEIQNNSNSVISIQNTFVNETHAIPKFPIYFTNPTTGIVYAITEVGHNFSILNSINNNDLNNNFSNKNDENKLSDNLKVPIYIPKEKYDNDIAKLKLKLKNQCSQLLVSQKLEVEKNTTKSIFNHHSNLINSNLNTRSNNSNKNPKKIKPNTNILTLDDFNKLQNFNKIKIQSTATPQLFASSTIPTLVVNKIKPIENSINESSEEDDDDDESSPFPNPAETVGDIFNDIYDTVGNNEESSSEESEEILTINQNNNFLKDKDKIVAGSIFEFNPSLSPGNFNVPNKFHNKLPFGTPDEHKLTPSHSTNLNSMYENFKPIPLVTTTLASFIHIPQIKMKEKYKKQNNTFVITKPINKYSSTIFSRHNLNHGNFKHYSSFIENHSRNVNKTELDFNPTTERIKPLTTGIFFEGNETPEDPIYDDKYLHKAGILVLKRDKDKTIPVNENLNNISTSNLERPPFNKDSKNFTHSIYGSLNFFEAPPTHPLKIKQLAPYESSPLNVLVGLSKEIQVNSPIHGKRRKLSKRSLNSNKDLTNDLKLVNSSSSTNVGNKKILNNFLHKEPHLMVPGSLKTYISYNRNIHYMADHDNPNQQKFQINNRSGITFGKQNKTKMNYEKINQDLKNQSNIQPRHKKSILSNSDLLEKLNKIASVVSGDNKFKKNSSESKSRIPYSKDIKFSNELKNSHEKKSLQMNKPNNNVLTTQIQVTSQFDSNTGANEHHRTSKENLKNSGSLTDAPDNKMMPLCNHTIKSKNKNYDDKDNDYDDDYYDFDNLLGLDEEDEDDDDDNNASLTYSDNKLNEDNSDYSSDVSENEEEIMENLDTDNDIEDTADHYLDSNENLPYRKKKTINKKRKKVKYKSYSNDDKDNEIDENEDDIEISDLMDAFTFPFRVVLKKFFEKVANYAGYNTKTDSIDSINDDYDNVADLRKPKYPQFTKYNNNNENVNTNTDGGGNWFSSFFNFWNSDPTIASNDETSSVSGWFDYLFGDDDDEKKPTPPTVVYNDYDYGSWLTNWFDKSTKKKISGTTTTISSTSTASPPILTIENPMKNSQKWIGILAQHIVDSTSSTSTPVVDEEEPKEKSYEKYQIWRLKPTDESHLKALQRLKKSSDGIRMQWLQGPTLRGLTDVLIPPELLANLQGTLNYEEINHEVLIYDVGKAIVYERGKENLMQTNSSRRVGLNSAQLTWNKYHNYDDIVRFVENLQARNPGIVELFHIGRSFEGRPLIVIKISGKENQPKIKNKLKEKKRNQSTGVFIEAGIQGREWITPATATWMINELVKIMKNNQTGKDNEFIKKATFYILPVLNPDGYKYTQKYDRMWKKSRSKYLSKPNGIISTAMEWFQEAKPGKICYGVDLDQNWEYGWGEKGSSKLPCNEFYAGPVAFSEPETRALSKFIMDHRKRIKLFISLKSYGQVISFPNKFSTILNSQKLDELLDVAMVGNDGLRKSGSESRYKVDSNNDLLATLSGSSNYFATYEASIPFSYTIHLGDNGVHGYLLPGSNIESTSRDAFHIIKSILDYI